MRPPLPADRSQRRRWWGGLAVLVAAGLYGCGSAPSEREETGDPPAAVQETIERMTVEGMDLYMHDYAPTHDGERKPTFYVHAESGEIRDGAKVWELKQTHAIVYREDSDDLLFEAAEGMFDEEKNLADLYGGVQVTAGTIKMETARIEWDNEAGEVRSSGAVSLVNGDTRLKAASLLIKPDDDRMFLTEGSGYISFSENPSK